MAETKLSSGTKTAHTKGKWELHIGNDYAVVMLPGECTETASITLRPDVAKRIGPLVAAAPDLLESVREFMSMEYGMDVSCQKRLIEKCMCRECVRERAKKLIVAATGTEV